ncbi:hypothetical protein IM543_12505 [Massilia sp. UMI-21]|nr:hypothetical protein IM543_12505 [Massilia sp. UMI-21]
MEKLIKQLTRLYLMPDAASLADLAQHPLVSLVSGDGMTRALVLDFPKLRKGAQDAHWTNLCAVANTLQESFGFPAPAVSITGDSGYRLWLSLAEPVPEGDVRRFVSMLREAQFPELELQPCGQVPLPPSLNPASGKWAAFIHPGMGASFAEEAGLEMAPPKAAQLAFLESLASIDKQQFMDALVSLKQEALPTLPSPPAEQPAPADSAPDRPASPPGAATDGLLLKDATLEDIVRHLHAHGIEPTFRHVLPASV